MVLLLTGLGGCNFTAPPKPVLPVQQTGELVVLTRNSPTTYYEDAEGRLAGIEHDLAELFAKDLGVKVRFVVANQFNEILPALQNHQAHLAAAGLSITPERQMKFKFSTPYQTIKQQVVYSTSGYKPANLKDLIGQRVEVVAGSSYAEKLREAKKKYPDLAWKENTSMESEELLEKLAMSQLDAVVADSNVVDVSKNYLPILETAFDLSEAQPLAWAFPKDVDNFLLEKSNDFFARIRKDGTLKRLLDRYYGHVNRLARIDVEGFMIASNGVLPKFRPLFHRAQELTELDWRLIAAIGYQESHWDPLATSPTGVRGLMMLTGDTADRLGVTDRLDPKQSILAGARYVNYLKDTVPERIPEPDRTWMALAAYNIGYGHLEDARILAKKKKLNPDSWTDLKVTLPLLSKSEYHVEAKHGYARGGETVIFVENIRTYYDIMSRFEKPYQRLFSATHPKAEPGTAASDSEHRYSLNKASSAKTSLGLKAPASALRPDKAAGQEAR
ncbi:MAG: membrane-bound lytic murein transglycosylase MltF [Sulfurimicrobium sp.]|nr:membrane-bound lytic murein transglycosylase MltF [Sulfurimicrobium sp.]MDZ7657138.1 membrane-bound lytic murein transglycosylase MltF [Sulfurimicrobium sp.]